MKKNLASFLFSCARNFYKSTFENRVKFVVKEMEKRWAGMLIRTSIIAFDMLFWIVLM